MFNESTLWDDCNYIGTKVSRFLEGPEERRGGTRPQFGVAGQWTRELMTKLLIIS